ncbi:MAG: lysophospholipase L1-like esterase [Cellvibrionaceae bacterium]|jgi:lysophospholipase L1-like esterase
MQQILVYSDSLSWGIIPGSRRRLTFEKRGPGVFEKTLIGLGRNVRVIENGLNGRRTVWVIHSKPVGMVHRVLLKSSRCTGR